MKKILCSLAIAALVISVASAQEKKVIKDEKTVKKTSSVPQKVHNTFSKHKKYNGKKIKETKTTQTTTPVQ